MESIKLKIIGVSTGDNTKVTTLPTKMNEAVKRPKQLRGSTYKIKPGEHAMYITINDIVLNPGTEFEEIRPFELFINSKDSAPRQWIDALTRVISANFRKGGDYGFLVEELKVITDPQGGYWSNGAYIPSVVAGVGHILEAHINAYVDVISVAPESIEEKDMQGMPEGATKCAKCQVVAVIQKDGCPTCLNCGESKCG